MILSFVGHKDRFDKIGNILKMFGAKNTSNYMFNDAEKLYCLNGSVVYSVENTRENRSTLNYAVFTLEEFEKTYPFMVGDKVIYKPYVETQIVSMKWSVLEVLYEVKLEDYYIYTSVDHLNYVEEDDMAKNKNKIKVEIPKGYQLVVENGQPFFEKVVEDIFPTTYAESCEILGLRQELCLKYGGTNGYLNAIGEKDVELIKLLENLRKLLICRDAYWKLLDNYDPMKSSNRKYVIRYYNNDVRFFEGFSPIHILMFPTKESRDKFTKTFKELIKLCQTLI